MKLRRLFAILFCFSTSLVNAQTPSAGSTQYDTLYVQQSPVVHKRNTVIRTEQQVKFYLSGYASLFKNYNYYIPCEGWENRLNLYKGTIDPALSYAIGLNLAYAPHKFVLTGGIDFAQIREKFNYTDESGNSFSNTNQYNYLDVNLTGGYWMNRTNNWLSLIMSGGVSYNYLLGEKGNIIDVNNVNEVISVSSSEKLRPNQFSITASCKFIFKPQSRIKYTVEPYYMGSIATITQAKYPYQQYYNRVGLRFGLMVSM